MYHELVSHYRQSTTEVRRDVGDNAGSSKFIVSLHQITAEGDLALETETQTAQDWKIMKYNHRQRHLEKNRSISMRAQLMFLAEFIPLWLPSRRGKSPLGSRMAIALCHAFIIVQHQFRSEICGCIGTFLGSKVKHQCRYIESCLVLSSLLVASGRSLGIGQL